MSGAALKHTAMVCMLADHVDKALLAPVIAADSMLWLRLLHGILMIAGRFAYPIYFFLLIEGFSNTGNRWKYLRNLLGFAFVSEIPFDLFISGKWLYWSAQNVYFVLVLALSVIWLIDAIIERTEYWILLMVPVVLCGCLTAEYGKIDYGSRGVLIPLAFYLFRSKPLAAVLVGSVGSIRDVWSLPAFWVTCLYNGERGRQCKWLNYWFYPLHLLLIGMIRLI